jgi:hypothetical protein
MHKITSCRARANKYFGSVAHQISCNNVSYLRQNSKFETEVDFEATFEFETKFEFI